MSKCIPCHMIFYVKMDFTRNLLRMTLNYWVEISVVLVYRLKLRKRYIPFVDPNLAMPAVLHGRVPLRGPCKIWDLPLCLWILTFG
jgi:hypothetical protein